MERGLDSDGVRIIAEGNTTEEQETVTLPRLIVFYLLIQVNGTCEIMLHVTYCFR